MSEKKWTPQQMDAIQARGGTVLVSAAAGSGKTAVLVERVIGRILDADNPIDADRMLTAASSGASADQHDPCVLSGTDPNQLPKVRNFFQCAHRRRKRAGNFAP